MDYASGQNIFNVLLPDLGQNDQLRIPGSRLEWNIRPVNLNETESNGSGISNGTGVDQHVDESSLPEPLINGVVQFRRKRSKKKRLRKNMVFGPLPSVVGTHV